MIGNNSTVELLNALPAEHSNTNAPYNNEQEASFSCLDLPETLTHTTKSIRRNRGDRSRPDEYFSESAAQLELNNCSVTSFDERQRAPQARYRRPSGHRPGDFLGGSDASFSYRPKSMRKSMQNDAFFSSLASTSHPEDSPYYHPASKRATTGSPSSSAKDVMADESLGCNYEKLHASHVTDRTMDESNMSSLASLRIDPVPERVGEEEEAEAKAEQETVSSLGDSSAEEKKRKKTSRTKRVAKPAGGIFLPGNTRRGSTAAAAPKKKTSTGTPARQGSKRPSVRRPEGPRPCIAAPKVVRALIPIEDAAHPPSPFDLVVQVPKSKTSSENEIKTDSQRSLPDLVAVVPSKEQEKQRKKLQDLEEKARQRVEERAKTWALIEEEKRKAKEEYDRIKQLNKEMAEKKKTAAQRQ